MLCVVVAVVLCAAVVAAVVVVVAVFVADIRSVNNFCSTNGWCNRE